MKFVSFLFLIATQLVLGDEHSYSADNQSHISMWDLTNIHANADNPPQKEAKLPLDYQFDWRPIMLLSPKQDYFLVADLISCSEFNYLSVHLDTMRSRQLVDTFVGPNLGGGPALGLNEIQGSDNNVLLMGTTGFLLENMRPDRITARAFSYTGEPILVESRDEREYGVDIDNPQSLEESFLWLDYRDDAKSFIIRDRKGGTQTIVPHQQLKEISVNPPLAASNILIDDISKGIISFGNSFKVGYLPWLETEPISVAVPFSSEDKDLISTLFFNQCLYLIKKQEIFIYDFRTGIQNMYNLLNKENLLHYQMDSHIARDHIFPNGKIAIFLRIWNDNSKQSLFNIFILDRTRLLHRLELIQRTDGYESCPSQFMFERVQCVDNYLVVPTEIKRDRIIYSFYDSNMSSDKPAFTLETKKPSYFYPECIQGKIWAFTSAKSPHEILNQ